MRISDWSSDVCSSDLQLNPAASIALGAVLRSWRHDEYRTKLPEKRKPTLARITIVRGAPETEQLFQRMESVAQGVLLTRELVTQTANIIYPQSFVERCRHLTELGVEITGLDSDDMRKRGLGALLGGPPGPERDGKSV